MTNEEHTAEVSKVKVLYFKESTTRIKCRNCGTVLITLVDGQPSPGTLLTCPQCGERRRIVAKRNRSKK